MAELVQPTKCSSLRKNGFVILGEGHACKIVDMTTSKTGKHGGAKVHLTGIDIFSDKKYEQIAGSTDNMDVPVINRADFQLIDIDDNDNVTLLDSAGETRSDLRLPNLCDADLELAEKIREAFDDDKDVSVTVVAAMNTEAIKGYKIGK
jgi:translation initiation factor 5A